MSKEQMKKKKIWSQKSQLSNIVFDLIHKIMRKNSVIRGFILENYIIDYDLVIHKRNMRNEVKAHIS